MKNEEMGGVIVKRRILCMVLSIAILFTSIDMPVLAAGLEEILETVSGNTAEEDVDVENKKAEEVSDENIIKELEEKIINEKSTISENNLEKLEESINNKNEVPDEIVNEEQEENLQQSVNESKDVTSISDNNMLQSIEDKKVDVLNVFDAPVETKKKITVSGDMVLDAGEGKIVIENIVWNYGTLTIKGEVEFLNNVTASTPNKRAISSSLILEEGANVIINGNLDLSLLQVEYGSAISLNVKPNSRLHVKGNMLAYKNGNGMQGYWYPRITLNGNVEIDGNFDVQGEYVHMNNENAYVLVKGNYKQEIGMYWGEYWWKECYLTNGILEVKGDYLYDSAGASGLGGNHTIVFSGEKAQNVRGIFKNVKVKNTSSTGVIFYELIQGGFSASGTKLPTQIWGYICVDIDAKISGSTVSSMLKNPVVSIEVKKLPNKCLYMPGDIFDSSGMELLVTYQNGVCESTFGGWTSNYKS